MKASIITIVILILTAATLHSQQENKHTQTELFLLNRQYTEAIEEAERVLAEDSISARGNFNMGQAYIGLLKYPEALEVFTRANELDPGNITILNAIGETWSALGVLNNAINTYYQIIQLDSTNYYGFIQLGKLYQRKNDFVRAIPVYQYLINLDSTNFYYYKQLGICFEKLDDDASSSYFLTRALNLNPRDVGLYPLLANIYIKNGAFQEAIDLLSAGLEQDSTEVSLIKIKSYAHVLAHQSEPAIQGFLKVLSTGDSSIFVNKYIGLAYFENEDYERSVNHLGKAYFADTSNAENCYYYALALAEDYHKRESTFYFLKSIELQQPNFEFFGTIYKKISENYNHVSDWENCLKYALLAYENNPEDRELLFRIASMYEYRMEDLKKALQYYTMFLEGAGEITETGEERNVISLAAVAAKRVEAIREELHFRGELDK
jgi:tetratricopeptide (TPR) repeat protein